MPQGITLLKQMEILNGLKPLVFSHLPTCVWDWDFPIKKKKEFVLEFNPLTARLIIVDRVFTQNLAQGETFFGVEADKTTRWEAGASLALQSELMILKNVILSQQLSLVANYLQEFKNIDVDYTINFNMKVNEYLSAILETQILYDDNALADLQFRQVFGLAVSLPF